MKTIVLHNHKEGMTYLVPVDSINYVIAFDDVTRVILKYETSMNAAAREALRILNLECASDDAASILRAMANVPNFIATYGKCLEQVGTPHSIEEIAAAVPNQEKWLRSLAINNWKIKD